MGAFELSVKYFLVVFVAEVSGFDIPLCKANDDACATKFAKAALPIIIAGDPSLGVNTSDPLYIKTISGDLSILKFSLMETNTVGFKNCDINKVKFDMVKSKLKFELTCPNLFVEGSYFITGRLIILPVEGNGTFSILCRQYKIGVDSDIATVKGKDGRNHYHLKKFSLALEAQKGITYDFKNLFNGNKKLGDVVLTFANRNWKEVADFVQVPVFNALLKKIISNVNKYLNTIPIEDFMQK